ncbi:hypothetical protein IC235_05630 [Hymenobacter sp. BT664]|uniref:Lipocalin-like domain-containing protein n=1 Tax=Hymenobacter montanus TaxID=2771359 RepID=A0A927BCA4_9BACT|nr:hypothetical protein [Hymenobacter montanus]MBD2767368.1 hypothetical protein [Hymenobacter montanus]
MLYAVARLLPLSVLLLGATCQQHAPNAALMPTSMKQLEGTWLVSREENSGDTLVYRPNTYKFPPSRGRTGFAIGPAGRFEQFDIAPTDGLAGHPGTWTADGNTRLRIHLTEGQEPDYTLEILSLSQGPKILKVRRQP